MFPMVPYHALPKLHAEIRDELPYVYPSVCAAYREIIPTLLRQRREPTYFIRHQLPAAMAEREMALVLETQAAA
jgi:fatty acid desaturase